MTEPETLDTEVVVVGAGPTGLMLACELTLAGVRTLVLERSPQRIEQVKGGGIQPRTAEMLQLRGLLAPLQARAAERVPTGGHFAALPVPLDCTPWRTRHPYPIAIPQWKVEEELEERAVAQGARVVRDAAVRAVEPDDDGVLVATSGGPRVRAHYAVACDGGHSTVRKLLGMPFPGRSGTHRAVLADVRLTAVSPQVPREMGHLSTLTRHEGGYWAMLMPLGGELYRLTYGRTGGTDAAGQEDAGRDDTGRDTPVTPEEITAALHAVYGSETTLGAVENASRFTDATRQLEHYRTGRVLFAGDAAHIHPPLGGQGLNLGIQDAYNLGWKLAATVQGRAPRGLLDSYHAERHPVAAQVLHHTSAQRVLANPNPGADVAALRDIVVDLLRLPDANRHIAGLMSGLSLRYDVPGDHPLTGHRVPDADLVTGAGATRLSALFGRGHAVLLDLTHGVPADLRLPPRIDLVHATRSEDSQDPEDSQDSQDIGAAALLLRPDGYVCWATDSFADDGETLHAAVRDHLATTP
ncbi:FAD-dependent monooxygenase [Streptomyces nanshensis]|uniref:Monooxygenase n=1 Tax=Streptomyces nanshensis TaxID=518642 RepID=A0A1E7L861_9ACTN|nr:FAD-dependent monooxygenase [Streptomyces nanshensis]OEV12397.1 monooxygenase [Streptomyces nanshensis]